MRSDGQRLLIGSEVELDVARRLHASGRSADGNEARAIALFARQDPIVLAQDAADDRTQRAVSREGSIGESSVCQDETDAGGSRQARDVRPDLRLHRGQDPRSVMGQESLHRCREIERKVGDRRFGIESPRLRLAGDGRGGEYDGGLRSPPQNLVDHRPRGERLADRHRMHPQVVSSGWRAIKAGAFGEVRQILPAQEAGQ